jgi:hypothetical protein
MAPMFAGRQLIAAVLALAIAAALAAVVVLGTGVSAGPRMSEIKVFRDAPGYAGDTQVSASVGEIWYGVSGEVPWVDAAGSWHGGGWPACVPPRTSVRVTFGGAVIFGPTGVGEYRMLWVDCRK